MRAARRLVALAAVVAAVAPSWGVPGALALELSPPALLAYADDLYGRGDYYRAIGEYDRLIFHFPSDRLAADARFRIAAALFRGQRWEEAARRFREIGRDAARSDLQQQALFMVGETYRGSGDLASAVGAYQAFIDAFPEGALAPQARLMIGWCLMARELWPEARGQILAANDRLPPGIDAPALAREAERGAQLPTRAPWVAGSLSAVLPGLGQLYVGRKTDAAVAFALNALFAWATVESFRDGDYVTGGILGTLEIGWYIGNIYGAAGSARKYNRAAAADFLRNVQFRYRIGGPGEVSVDLGWRF